MPRPVPTPILHFTHVDNLPRIISAGLIADSGVLKDAVGVVDVGMPAIKASRRARVVPVEPGGVVSDYVPFYFAPRSPMMSSISHGNVPQYLHGCEPLIYLVTSVEALVEAGLDVVTTDRNAALAVAAFERARQEWGTTIDWDLMKATWWHNTAEEPDRRERRMAECLVHHRVAWSLVSEVGAMNESVAARARSAIMAAGLATPVNVRAHWYI